MIQNLNDNESGIVYALKMSSLKFKCFVTEGNHDRGIYDNFFVCAALRRQKLNSLSVYSPQGDESDLTVLKKLHK